MVQVQAEVLDGFSTFSGGMAVTFNSPSRAGSMLFVMFCVSSSVSVLVTLKRLMSAMATCV